MSPSAKVQKVGKALEGLPCLQYITYLGFILDVVGQLTFYMPIYYKGLSI
jgi:hypothetical protein